VNRQFATTAAKAEEIQQAIEDFHKSSTGLNSPLRNRKQPQVPPAER
jgi:hypothetical protein